MDQQRDEYGRFLPKGVKTSSSVSGPELTNPELEKPLVQLSVTNPFKKILYWLDQIRRKQTTTFMIKLSIPLIALPIVAFAFFQLGRGSYLLPFSSHILPAGGTITPILTPVADLQVSRSGTLKVAKGQQTKYLLSLKDGGILLLELPTNLNLDKYQGKQILVTGTYRRSTNILKVEDIAEIESLDPIPLPTATPTITPTPTLTATPTPSPTQTPTPTP